MMTIQQFMDLRAGKCLKKLSYPISYLYAFFLHGKQLKPRYPRGYSSQPTNINDSIITQIPYLEEQEWDSNYLTVKFNKRISWLHKLETGGLSHGAVVIQFHAWLFQLPIYHKLVNRHQKHLFYYMGLGGPRMGKGLNKVLIISRNSLTNRSSLSLFIPTFLREQAHTLTQTDTHTHPHLSRNPT